MTMNEAVDALTRPWSDIVTTRENGDSTYRVIDHAPLLDMLHDRIRSNSGGTTAGGGVASERNLIDVAAFTLWEDIDGRSRAWWRELSHRRASTDLKDVVRELAGMAQAQRAIGGIDDLMYVRITAQFGDWQTAIWNMFDPPVVKELIGACPQCDERWLYAPDGAKSSALITYYVKSEMPEAKCQRCGHLWVGSRQLLTLGFHLGATVDVEGLREMGVEVEGAA